MIGRHSILFFLLLLPPAWSSADSCDFLPAAPQPEWTFDSPAIDGYYTGVGLAEEDDDGADAQIEKSKLSALGDLAGNIEVSVRSSLKIEIREQRSDGDADVDKDITQISEAVASTSLEDVEVDATWLDRKRCIVWTRVKIARSVIRAKQHRELQNRKLALLDSYYNRARDKSASATAKSDALDQAYILFNEIDFTALKGITSKAYYQRLLDNLAKTVRRSARAGREAGELRAQAEKLLLEANNATDAASRSSKTAEALGLLKKIIAANPIGTSGNRHDGELAAFKIAEVELLRNNSCEAQFQYEIVRDRTTSADWKSRAAAQARKLKCTRKKKKDMAWRRAFDGVTTTYLCATDIAGNKNDWGKPCENMQGFLAGFGAIDGPYPEVTTDQLVRLAYRLDKDKNAAGRLGVDGRVLLFVGKGKLKQRKNDKNPMGQDHQFSGKIYSYVINDGKLEFKDKYTGTGGWNPVSGEMAVEVLGLNAAKRFRQQYLKHIRNN